MEKLPLDRARWPFIALLASAAMLATAHAFERFLFLAPCPLCYTQRQVYWVAGGLAILTIMLNWRGAPPKLMAAFCMALGLVFLVGAGYASYHSLVEWGILPAPDTCAAAGRGAVSQNLWDQLNKPIAVPSCADAKWRMIGLSMAGWNAIVSALLAAASFLSAMRPERTDTANEPVKLEEEAA